MLHISLYVTGSDFQKQFEDIVFAYDGTFLWEIHKKKIHIHNKNKKI